MSSWNEAIKAAAKVCTDVGEAYKAAAQLAYDAPSPHESAEGIVLRLNALLHEERALVCARLAADIQALRHRGGHLSAFPPLGLCEDCGRPWKILGGTTRDGEGWIEGTAAHECDGLGVLGRFERTAAGTFEIVSWTGTWCPRCGPDVPLDKHGFCDVCGSEATGEGAEEALRLRRCPVCDGHGELAGDTSVPQPETDECPICQGSGKAPDGARLMALVERVADADAGAGMARLDAEEHRERIAELEAEVAKHSETYAGQPCCTCECYGRGCRHGLKDGRLAGRAEVERLRKELRATRCASLHVSPDGTGPHNCVRPADHDGEHEWD